MNIEKIIKRKQHAKRNGNLHQLAEITKTLGDMYFENEQPNKALLEYQEQSRICEDLQDKLNCAIAHRMIGEVYASLGDYEQALVHQNLHLTGARDMNNLIEEQRALATLGRTHFCLAESLSSQPQKHDEALLNAKMAYVESMELCDKISDAEIKSEEKTLMQARLLLNLGLTLEAQKETRRAIDLIERATTLCVSNNFQEDLHRTCISLATIYERQGDHEQSLSYIETAATVNNVSLKAEAKLTKAELFMRSGQWIEARKVLVSLYTSSGLPKSIIYQVEKYLRVVVTLCRTENNLLIETDVQAKQKLYETLGDAAVAAQCFNKGVEYYRHMLTCAEETGNQIGVALISLAQTLKDAERYKEALPFAQKELELCINSREKSRSALFLADLLITTEATDAEIREYYSLALSSANESDNIRLQKTAAKELVGYLENTGQFDEAMNIKQRSGLTLEVSSDTESEVSSAENEIGMDICLEDLSDLEVDRNIETTNVSRRKARRTIAIKRNEKGETQLHVACINGDIVSVEGLLSSGHSTNVRDNYGWSPLHEAANHGYVEIAELLLKHGASINDPGGASCKGVTPLHDAACCGHLSMMQLLMQYGANITLKTHDGDTVLDCLEDWRDRVEDLSPEDLIEYETLHKKLSAVIPRRNKRKRLDVKTPSKNSLQSEKQKISAGEDYKRTIENLRSFNKTNPVTAFKSSNHVAAPLVNEEQIFLDDWLEDDIGNTVKKKSTSSNYKISKRKSADENIEGTVKRLKQDNRNKEDFSVSEDSNDSAAAEVIQLFEEPERTERKGHATLLSCGFTVSRTPSPIHPELSPHTSTSCKQCNKEYVNLHIFIKEKEFDLKVDVSEDEQEFLMSIITKLEHMFFNETGCTAKLRLQSMNENVTKEAILKIAREKDTYVKDRLKCEIIEMQVPSIVERYRTICCSCNIIPCDIMLKCLKSCENTSVFRIKPNDVRKELLAPLLKTLEYQQNVKLLELSGTILLTTGPCLRQCFLNLSSLQELYLKGCDIDAACLREITSLPSELRVLDLSYNPLTLASHETLQRLITPLKYLRTLNLRYCQLEDFCLSLDNPNLTSCDISWNKLNRDAITSFLCRQLFDLNLSNTIPLLSRQSISSLDIRNIALSSSLESLELSFSNITDSDVKIILVQLPRLSRLILSGNTNVSVLSVNMLVSHSPTLTYIDVSGCKTITSNPETGLSIQNPKICTLFASIESSLCDSWLKLWRGVGIVIKLPHNLAVFKPV